jgi:hypothetical protein
MVDAASILHEHHDNQMTVYQGSKKGRLGNVSRNRFNGHARLYKDYFHLTDLVYKEELSPW